MGEGEETAEGRDGRGKWRWVRERGRTNKYRNIAQER
jgi:hypothetical protein